MKREEMTKEEAITLLRANVMVACDTSDKVGYGTPLNKAIEQALDMAIKVLEQETVPREHYEHEFFLRKELDFKVARLEKQIAEQESSEDCVSREQALKELKESAEHHANDSREEILLRRDRDIIRALPPITTTRKKGKWIRVDHNKVKCSKCEITHLIAQYPHGAIDFCPNCGAEMESENV